MVFADTHSVVTIVAVAPRACLFATRSVKSELLNAEEAMATEDYAAAATHYRRAAAAGNAEAAYYLGLISAAGGDMP